MSFMLLLVLTISQTRELWEEWRRWFSHLPEKKRSKSGCIEIRDLWIIASQHQQECETSHDPPGYFPALAISQDFGIVQIEEWCSDCFLLWLLLKVLLGCLRSKIVCCCGCRWRESFFVWHYSVWCSVSRLGLQPPTRLPMCLSCVRPFSHVGADVQTTRYTRSHKAGFYIYWNAYRSGVSTCLGIAFGAKQSFIYR